MATVQVTGSELLVTVKSREVQRGILAEMRGDSGAARRHFLAAAHLEIVLATDYASTSQDDLSLRSRLSAASCFWRAGETERARDLLAELAQEGPEQATAAAQVLRELASPASPHNS
jgi:outer membrane PBP1 activator LpoA protein